MINLVDVSGFIYRAFYALPSLTYNDKELGATYGFCSAMLKITSIFPNSMFIAALDSGKKTFRNEIYPDYKANRKAMPEDLLCQVPIIKEACERFGFTIAVKQGFEADDIIATCVRLIDTTKHKVNIITSDKDLSQLLGSNVAIYDPMKQKYITEEDIIKKFGVTHDKVLDVLSLMGDASDNIPGVPGVGPKTAAALINEFGSLNELMEHLEDLPNNKRNETLKNEIEKAVLSKELATLRDDVDLEINYNVSKPNGLQDFLLNMGFKSLAKKLETQSIAFMARPIISESEDSFTIPSEYITKDFVIKHKLRLEDSRTLKISDDIKKLAKTCLAIGVCIKNTVDVSVLSYCISGTKIKHDLASMAEEYLGLSQQALSHPDDTLKKIYEHLVASMDDRTKYLFNEIENRLTLVLAKMEHDGITLDISYLNDLSIYFKEKIDELARDIYKISGTGFNIASPKQVSFILYEKLGFPTDGKKRSTDSETLSSFPDFHNNIAEKILLWRGYSKLLNTYVIPLIKLADDNHRVHTTYLQTVVNTGRLSSTNPNLQNIPARTDEGIKIRKAFIATTKQNKLISFDYSQIELRILAHISNCNKLIAAFEDGRDIHVSTASHIFNVSESNVTKEQRRLAKEINFSLIYGMSIYRLSSRLGISHAEAKEIYTGFIGLYPEISDYIKQTEESALINGYVETILGRRCFVPLIKSKSKNLVAFAKRQAVNAPIQGSNADIIKLAMVKINENSRKNFKLLLQIHDELIVETPEQDVEEVSTIVKNTMENVVKLKVPITVNVKVGSHI